MALEPIPTRDAEATDAVVYPVSDDMGESSHQLFVVRTLLDLFEDYFAALERPVFAGGNQFFYYKRGDPRAVVAPDVYTIDDETLPPSGVQSWKTWEHDGKGPTLVIEIVSDEYGKDYSERSLERYQQLGVREFVRFDPRFGARKSRERLTHYVRDERGQLVRQLTASDRVRLLSYDFWLVVQAGDVLRMGVGPKGTSLWPTRSERVDAETKARAVAEAAREAAEVARAEEAAAREAAEAARAEEAAAREAAEAAQAAAEAENQRLRAELAALRGR